MRELVAQSLWVLKRDGTGAAVPLEHPEAAPKIRKPPPQAVFKPTAAAGRPAHGPRQYKLMDWPQPLGPDDFAKGPTPIYRGPDLAWVLAPLAAEAAPANFRQAGPQHPLLAAVELPGLPEGRPYLVVQVGRGVVVGGGRVQSTNA
jgi:hypothetical protein